MTTPTTTTAQTEIDSYFEAAAGRLANVRLGLSLNKAGKNFTEIVPGKDGGTTGSLFSDRLAADGTHWMKKAIHKDPDTGGIECVLRFGATDMVTFHAVLKQVTDGLINVTARALASNWKNFAVPTFTTLTTVLRSIAASAEASVTLAQIATQSNAAAAGSIVGYVVQAVTVGTLRIGLDQTSATAYAAGTNDTIDATRIAYYTMPAGGGGSVNVFTLKAKDDKGWLSASAIQAAITRT